MLKAPGQHWHWAMKEGCKGARSSGQGEQEVRRRRTKELVGEWGTKMRREARRGKGRGDKGSKDHRAPSHVSREWNSLGARPSQDTPG